MGEQYDLPLRTTFLLGLSIFHQRVRPHHPVPPSPIASVLTDGLRRPSTHRMKVTVFCLLRALEFEPGVPPEDIDKSVTILSRPIRISDPKAGPQMPLLIRPYRGRD